MANPGIAGLSEAVSRREFIASTGSGLAALAAAGCANVTVLTGDGTLGRRSLGPFDAILISAAGPVVPDPLIDQLADDGCLVMPIQRDSMQELTKLTRRGDEIERESLGSAHFVPLVGRHGVEDPTRQ